MCIKNGVTKGERLKWSYNLAEPFSCLILTPLPLPFTPNSDNFVSEIVLIHIDNKQKWTFNWITFQQYIQNGIERMMFSIFD